MEKELDVLLIYCRARSGSYFVHSLFDGHPDAFSLPPLKTTRQFFHSTEEFWSHSGAPGLPEDAMIRAFVERNPTLFDARGRAGGQGYDRMGESGSDALSVDSVAFADALARHLKFGGGQMTRRAFFVAVHRAYDEVAHVRTVPGRLIVYQAHNPLDDVGNGRLLDDFPDAKLVLTMQEPVRALVSLIYQKNSDNIAAIASNGRFLLCFKAAVEGWRGLRRRVSGDQSTISCMNALNSDLKRETERLCEFAGIEWVPSIVRSTFNGQVWNGDNWSKLPPIAGLTTEGVRAFRTRAVLFRHDEVAVRVLGSDVRKVCCFDVIGVAGIVGGFFALFLPMKVELLGALAALRAANAQGFFAAAYFYMRRVLLSLKLWFDAAFFPISPESRCCPRVNRVHQALPD